VYIKRAAYDKAHTHTHTHTHTHNTHTHTRTHTHTPLLLTSLSHNSGPHSRQHPLETGHQPAQYAGCKNRGFWTVLRTQSRCEPRFKHPQRHPLLHVSFQIACARQACALYSVWYGTLFAVRTVISSNYGVITILEERNVLNYSKSLYGVRYSAKLALPVQSWTQKGHFSAPTPPISTSSMLLSRVDATQCFPERP